MSWSRSFFFGLFLTLCLCAAEHVSAQVYKAEVFSEGPPTELAGLVRDALSPTGIRVTSGAVCDISLRKAVPGKANAAQTLGAIYD